MAFEEFRGFFIRGQHRRTQYQVKDLFIHSALGVGLGYASNLPLSVWAIDANELGSDTTTVPATERVMNFNWLNNSLGSQDGPDIPRLGPQSGLEIVDLGSHPSPERFGQTTNEIVGSPNEQQGPILIYPANVRGFSPSHSDPVTPDPPFDDLGVRYIVAHEVGHGVAMQHFFPGNPPYPTSVMVTFYLGPTQDTNDPRWNNVPSLYSVTDWQAIRLR